MKNILFVLTDDQRYNCLRAAGNPDIITPNLDRLAENGTLFTQAHIPCGTSGAVCMPSRAMLHTGRTLFHIQGEGQDIPGEHITMGECFRNAGYETFGTGKWHNGTPAYSRSFSCGENAFFGGMWDHWNVPVCRYDPTGEYDNIINFVMNFYGGNDVTKIHCDKFNPGIHSTELLTNTAVDWLGKRSSGEKPFFLYLAYLAPHDPRTMPERFLKMYDPAKIALPDNFMENHPFPFGVEHIRDEVLMRYPRDRNETKRHLAEYYAMVTHLDYEFGRIIETLEKTGQLNDTIIVFTGDNGLAVGSHGLMGKQNVYDHSVRVPLIMSGPGIPRGSRRDGYVYLLDIFPTLAELCGIKAPSSVEGKSFAGMFTDSAYRTRETLYFAYCDLIRGVKDSGFKLIEYRRHANATQLFNLAENPGETVNLADNPGYASILENLRRLMFQYRDEWEDSGHRHTGAFWDAY